ncbi:hypothetical protein K490DRAFT_69505 [Saccharata proteae CBS 121410]|uniref:Inheritance of peroxisomes protein 1 n=1 Tax=Saccharata proteae CBS 121410 TaxID=1314787 RepID=A0A9P4HLE6_9PEZI|nr:hypothetical protein K490DRAFT_69505 [Saccharata proteae CBS 121410]
MYPTLAVPDGGGRRTSVDNSGLRRSFTAPVNATRPRTADSASPGASDGVETLFVHNFARIVLFTASSPSRPSTSSSSSRGTSKDKDTGTQPWVSPTETTQASGPLRLYRVPGSVAFLHSGNLLHAILPRSQCWCVDGVSKFALRIPRPNSYYRIELPADGEENSLKVEEFKVVLEKILQYEKTPCPFTRGFHVDLPEIPISPARRRRPVTPKAKKWKLDKIWRPEDGGSPGSHNGDESISDLSTPVSEEDDRMSQATESTIEEQARPSNFTPPTPPTVKPLPRPRDIENFRSITAPAQLPFGREPQSAMLAVDEANDPVSDTASISSTVDSFYSFGESSGRSPPSPPASIYLEPSSSPQSSAKSATEEASPGRVSIQHKRDVSELTITPHPHHSEDERSPLADTPRADGASVFSPLTPTLTSDSASAFDMSTLDVPTTPDNFRLRHFTNGVSQRRALSPLPHVANLYTPPPPPPRKEFGTALVQKTMGILMSPPAHLVALMLRIAARISHGGLTPDSFRLRRAATRIPGSWQQWSEDEGDEWDEDDYGIPLNNLKKRGSKTSTETSDVD